MQKTPTKSWSERFEERFFYLNLENKVGYKKLLSFIAAEIEKAREEGRQEGHKESFKYQKDLIEDSRQAEQDRIVKLVEGEIKIHEPNDWPVPTYQDAWNAACDEIIKAIKE